MSPETIQTVVLDVLKEVQKLCGRKWEGVPIASKPLGTLAGFDSLCSIEATVLVEQKLGCARLGASSLFISEDGKRALTLQEICHRIHKLVTDQGKQ